MYFFSPGLKDLKTVSQHTPLVELGLDSMMTVEIQECFQRKFKIFVSMEYIRHLNFAKLLAMDAEEVAAEKRDQSNKENNTSFNFLLHIVNTRALDMEIDFKLSTTSDMGGEKVFLVPGFNGCQSIFSMISKNIKAPATCLQLGLSEINQLSITDMALKLFPVRNCYFYIVYI